MAVPNHSRGYNPVRSSNPIRSPRPAQGERAVQVERVGRDAEGLAQVELRPTTQSASPAASAPAASSQTANPVAPRPRARVSGPGRKEREYIERIGAAERELEIARLLERGTNRLVDRLEHDVDEARRLERRLILAMGAMQAENQALRARLSARLA